VVVITQREKMREAKERRERREEEEEGSEKKRVHLLNECDRELPTT